MDQYSSNSEKVAFFRSMFVGRKNVFARRFESAKTGKKGYSSYCENQWVRGVCGLLKGWKCSDCPSRHRGCALVQLERSVNNQPT